MERWEDPSKPYQPCKLCILGLKRHHMKHIENAFRSYSLLNGESMTLLTAPTESMPIWICTKGKERFVVFIQLRSCALS